MDNSNVKAALILGVFISIGLATLGYLIGNGIVKIKAMERTIEVKGLSEREVPANIAIWPIKFNEADNDLTKLFTTIQSKNAKVIEFLKRSGFKDNEISTAAPAIFDRQAQEHEGSDKGKFRYSGSSTITVYSENVDLVRKTMANLVELGKEGIAISGQNYQSKADFVFTKLNEIKPIMIEEATKNARAVAEKFAQDSKSKLGKIKTASQGQFSIDDRDSNTPHIKKIRVVSSLSYYLSD
jgi:hypothetical protein